MDGLQVVGEREAHDATFPHMDCWVATYIGYTDDTTRT